MRAGALTHRLGEGAIDMVAVGTRLTLEEFLALPEEKPALEYIDGMVTQKMSPKAQHSALQMALAERLNRAGQPKLRAFPELRVTFAGASRVPDISVFRVERMAVDARGRLANDVLIPPDVVVEITSLEDSPNELLRKCRWCVANGVGTALIVDPDDQSVIALWPGGRIDEWTGADHIDLLEVLPKLDLSVQDLMGALSPQRTA
jgi:Uma2 family endonuclease